MKSVNPMFPQQNPQPRRMPIPQTKTESVVPPGFEIVKRIFTIKSDPIPSVSVYKEGLNFNAAAHELFGHDTGVPVRVLIDETSKRILVQTCAEDSSGSRKYRRNVACRTMVEHYKILRRKYPAEKTEHGIQFSYATIEDAKPDEIL